jgi:hypothetical protein
VEMKKHNYCIYNGKLLLKTSLNEKEVIENKKI